MTYELLRMVACYTLAALAVPFVLLMCVLDKGESK